MSHAIVQHHDGRDGSRQGKGNLEEEPALCTAVNLRRLIKLLRNIGLEESPGHDHVVHAQGAGKDQGPHGVQEPACLHYQVGRNQAAPEEHSDDVEYGDDFLAGEPVSGQRVGCGQGHRQVHQHAAHRVQHGSVIHLRIRTDNLRLQILMKDGHNRQEKARKYYVFFLLQRAWRACIIKMSNCNEKGVNRRMPFYAISLFSGAGGFDLGMEAAGFTTRLCTDIDLHSCQTLQNNKDALANNHQHSFLSHAVIKQKNIKEYSTDEILKDAGLKKEEVSLVYGGPPCQSFSVFGQRKGMEDPRGTLLWDYLRVIREIEPACFIFENVAGLLSIDDGKVFKQFLGELSKDANGNQTYTVSHYLLDTASFGVPQYRSRVIIYGVKGKTAISMPRKTHALTDAEVADGLLPPVTVGDAILSLPSPPSNTIANHVGRVHGQAVINRYSALTFGERDSKTRINKLNPDKPSFTIVVGSDKGGGKGHVHPYSPREVTPRESARLQTFPDYWAFSGTSRHPIRQVGNAVPPVFAAVIGAHLLEEAFGVKDVPDYNEIIRRLGSDYLLK